MTFLILAIYIWYIVMIILRLYTIQRKTYMCTTGPNNGSNTFLFAVQQVPGFFRDHHCPWRGVILCNVCINYCFSCDVKRPPPFGPKVVDVHFPNAESHLHPQHHTVGRVEVVKLVLHLQTLGENLCQHLLGSKVAATPKGDQGVASKFQDVSVCL